MYFYSFFNWTNPRSKINCELLIDLAADTLAASWEQTSHPLHWALIIAPSILYPWLCVCMCGFSLKATVPFRASFVAYCTTRFKSEKQRGAGNAANRHEEWHVTWGTIQIRRPDQDKDTPPVVTQPWPFEAFLLSLLALHIRRDLTNGYWHMSSILVSYRTVSGP